MVIIGNNANITAAMFNTPVSKSAPGKLPQADTDAPATYIIKNPARFSNITKAPFVIPRALLVRISSEPVEKPLNNRLPPFRVDF